MKDIMIDMMVAMMPYMKPVMWVGIIMAIIGLVFILANIFLKMDLQKKYYLVRSNCINNCHFLYSSTNSRLLLKHATYS